jgi:hypothetical protein
VSFTTRPLYPRGKRPWFPLCRSLGGPQSLCGRCEEKILDPTGTQTPNLRSSSLYLTTVYRLLVSMLISLIAFKFVASSFKA